MATKLSVNINKIATLRNARGGNNPDVIKVALDCESFGAQGITVHPRPDERHIRYRDVVELKSVMRTELNIEGYPDTRYMKLLREVTPGQATLVPDPPDALTSNAGWDILKHQTQLREIVSEIKSLGIRVSLFIDPVVASVEAACSTGTDRIELYTGPFAHQYSIDPAQAVECYVNAAKTAKTLNLGINAGHDLDLNNLRFLKMSIPLLDEVSIGHALISDALYLGLENSIQLYLRQLAV